MIIRYGTTSALLQKQAAIIMNKQPDKVRIGISFYCQADPLNLDCWAILLYINTL
jgi:hypothetical protein